MAYQKKTWYNEKDIGATDENSVANKTNMNDLENRIFAGFNPKNVTEANTDLNNYIETGFYFFESTKTPTNIPVGVNGWLQVIKGSGNFVKQIWYRAGTKNDNDFETYVRTKSDSGWSEWRQYSEIIEASLSENGYVRFSNGLQIAWKTISLNIEPAQHGSLWYLYNTESYAWPKSFKMIFSKFASTNSPGFFAAGVTCGTVNITNVRAYRAVNDGNQVTLYVIGIGTWK